MKRLEYTVSFTTPAFLGNAEQQAQWRTPPFKALISQWWRVVRAQKVGYDVARLRCDEGALFGSAADGSDSRRSLVRFRLSAWELGKMDRWESDDRLLHPEVTNRQGEVMQIGAQLYLGYGPLTFGDMGRRNQQGRPMSGTVLNQNPKRTAVADSSSQTLTIMVSEADHEEIISSVRLAAWFGTLGSRSRNGWGALQIVAERDTSPIPELTIDRLEGVLRPLRDCLDEHVGCDWPHAIGSVDNRPLVWKTQQKASWREVMNDLARIKIAFRTQKALSLDKVLKGQFAKRHLLAYPITNHPVDGSVWGTKGRLANQIRFKVMKERNQWHGVIAHLPCRLPAEMIADLPLQHRNNLNATALAAWQAVHAVLDQNAQRIH